MSVCYWSSGRYITMVAALIMTIEVFAGDREAGNFEFNPKKYLISAPNDATKWPVFREQLAQWRQDTRNQLNYNDEFYRRPEFTWSATNYACCFLMMCDETFYNSRDGNYTVDSFLEQGIKEFGGYDSVILWHAYPRIGVDERNQFDFLRDMPGGLAGVSEVVRQFHRRGVKVYIAYNPWDTGTRRENRPDIDVLADIVKIADADGVFLDTMKFTTEDFRTKLDAVKPGVILETELPIPLEKIYYHHASWAQDWEENYKDKDVPGVMSRRWFERRHMQHQISRWKYSHIGELQSAWINGSGILIWENVFASWVPWSERDKSIIRCILPIQRRYSYLFSGEDWVPLVPSEQTRVYASLWQKDGLRLWTLINRNETIVSGPLLKAASEKSQEFFDLAAGRKANSHSDGNEILLSGTIQPLGVGCFLAATSDKLGADFERFLKNQAEIGTRANFDGATPRRETRLVSVAKTTPRASVPDGMVEVPAATLELEIDMKGRECGFYESMPPAGSNIKADYASQPGKFHRKVEFKRFAIDEIPVTNSQFAEFLKVSGYLPKHKENFLKHWVNGKPPLGKEDHPVVYVDLDDARAYARWAGKRLATEEEWQYAAQGPDRAKYPWGNVVDATYCNAGQFGGTSPVKAFPQGRSRFGCYDMCGNVWQWTESERSDGRTRFCIIRGGSWFEAKGSEWYPEGGPCPIHAATKFLLMWPGLDRCSTIGFRCVCDLR